MPDNTQTIEHIKTKVDDIYLVLHGSSKDSEPDGLVQKVSTNTNFRESWSKFLWIVLTAFIGLGGSLIVLLIRMAP